MSTTAATTLHAASPIGHAFPSWVRFAALPDAEAITSLVNSAYRPNKGQRGWTHEADLLDGSRIDHAQMAELFSRPDSVILLGHHDNSLISCVHVQKHGMSCSIGMLAVHPNFQRLGLGAEMLQRAEFHARAQFQSNKAFMSLITRRTELMSFYLSRGYRLTGETEAYPLSAGVGVPKCNDLSLAKLEKSLDHEN
jgi:GNAT superfamily N-acetyltransferase